MFSRPEILWSKGKWISMIGFFHWSYLFQFSKTKKKLNVIYENLKIWWPHGEIKFFMKSWENGRIIYGIQIKKLGNEEKWRRWLVETFFFSSRKRFARNIMLPKKVIKTTQVKIKKWRNLAQLRKLKLFIYIFENSWFYFFAWWC